MLADSVSQGRSRGGVLPLSRLLSAGRDDWFYSLWPASEHSLGGLVFPAVAQ